MDWKAEIRRDFQHMNIWKVAESIYDIRDKTLINDLSHSICDWAVSRPLFESISAIVEAIVRCYTRMVAYGYDGPITKLDVQSRVLQQFLMTPVVGYIVGNSLTTVLSIDNEFEGLDYASMLKDYDESALPALLQALSIMCLAVCRRYPSESGNIR